MKLRECWIGGALALAATLLTPNMVSASSHREAPFITKNPKVDGTDFYMFDSYESGRAGYVTILANYVPLQPKYGGPNFFALDPDAIYEIHIDNTGDGIEDLTFQFDFDEKLGNNGSGVALDIGGTSVAIPLATAGPLANINEPAQNLIETYTLGVIRGPRRASAPTLVTNMADGTTTFHKPFDDAGQKTIADYGTYANKFIASFDIPGCTPTGVAAGTHSRVFVGQRAEGFAVNLGQIFDLVNLGVSALGIAPATGEADLTGAQDQGKSVTSDDNITTLAIEVPVSCITKDASSPIIAGWTTASLRQARVLNPTATFDNPSREGGAWVQVSRVSAPLINEVIIGLPDKDKFNGSEPKDDAQFAAYVTNPTLPALVEAVFGATGMLAPTTFPRTDLVAAFLNGVPTVNVMSSTLFEALRLNTAVAATTQTSQSSLGAATCFDTPVDDAHGPALDLASGVCDPAGFPNGRRPGDDVVDIELRVAMGFLLDKNHAPIRAAPLVDGAAINANMLQAVFPYLNNPTPGNEGT